MSRKTFCDLCGAEIKGHAAKVVAVSAEYEKRYGYITSNDAMDNAGTRRKRMNKRAMISQPMAGKTDEEIAEARDKARAKLHEMGYEFVNTMFTDEWYSEAAMEERGVVQVPLCYLAKSLESMSLCHAAYFCKGWENARGCRIEHDAAIAYGLEVLYED